jgi:hypothetical protein
LTIDARALFSGQLATWDEWKALDGDAQKTGNNSWAATIPALGYSVLQINVTLQPDPEGPEFRNFTVSTTVTGEVTVNWEFWANATSWSQWRTNATSEWTSAASQFAYNFTNTVNVNSSSVDIRIATNMSDSPLTGYSDVFTYAL